MPEVKVGDKIRHHGLGDDSTFDVEVLEIGRCSQSEEGNHPSYKIIDPTSHNEDWVCSLDFGKVEA